MGMQTFEATKEDELIASKVFGTSRWIDCNLWYPPVPYVCVMRLLYLGTSGYRPLTTWPLSNCHIGERQTSCLKSAENQANVNPMSKVFLARPGRAKGKCREMSQNVVPNSDFSHCRVLPHCSHVHGRMSMHMCMDMDTPTLRNHPTARSLELSIRAAWMQSASVDSWSSPNIFFTNANTRSDIALKAWVHTKEKPLEIR